MFLWLVFKEESQDLSFHKNKILFCNLNFRIFFLSSWNKGTGPPDHETAWYQLSNSFSDSKKSGRLCMKMVVIPKGFVQIFFFLNPSKQHWESAFYSHDNWFKACRTFCPALIYFFKSTFFSLPDLFQGYNFILVSELGFGRLQL